MGKEDTGSIVVLHFEEARIETKSILCKDILSNSKIKNPL